MTTQMTINDLKTVLVKAAGEGEGAGLDGDIADMRFEELGYDSLALMEAGSLIEHEHGIRIDEEELAGAETPGSLLKTINAYLA
ncbi:acyl carrier protein [Nocardiopsis alborubida]|uniref:Acyl carrier protein n=2 Tax=Nocardiopsis TaxID=2013 RepID=A0A7X6RNY7_9ACTN|nr:acyl carrier protein [Nocardiopsis alborubida]NKY97179.1 acyl carrier protein [Nocardiopsis alborubida]QOP59272.1 acyl carrier protein [Nocardiopsis sp.]